MKNIVIDVHAALLDTKSGAEHTKDMADFKFKEGVPSYFRSLPLDLTKIYLYFSDTPGLTECQRSSYITAIKNSIDVWVGLQINKVPSGKLFILKTQKELDDVTGCLDYDEWCSLNEDDIYIEAAESGADREFGYDSERYIEKSYEQYRDSFIVDKLPSASN